MRIIINTIKSFFITKIGLILEGIKKHQISFKTTTFCDDIYPK